MDWISKIAARGLREKRVLVSDFVYVIINGEVKQKAKSPQEFLDVPEVDGAIESLAIAIDKLSPNRVHVVTRVDNVPEIRAMYLEWFHHHEVFKRTGLILKNILFCNTREEKGRICFEKGATSIVDDRIEVHWSVAKTYGVKLPPGLVKRLELVKKRTAANFEQSPEWLHRYAFNIDLENALTLQQWPEGILTVPNWQQVVAKEGFLK